MFTECVITEIVKDLGLRNLNEVVVAERASKVLAGLSFKENTLAFYIPSERDFYKLTGFANASPVDNFNTDKQHITISTKFGKVHFYNKYVNIDDLCNWDTELGIFYYHEPYLRRCEMNSLFEW